MLYRTITISRCYATIKHEVVKTHSNLPHKTHFIIIKSEKSLNCDRTLFISKTRMNRTDLVFTFVSVLREGWKTLFSILDTKNFYLVLTKHAIEG
jgi:hypothetical protein